VKCLFVKRLLDPRYRKLYSYGAVVLLYVVVSAWWIIFFAHQGDLLVRRIGARGVTLDREAERALREATDESMRMFIFEGGFLGLMLLASVALVVRALQRELAAHLQRRNFLSAVTHELKTPIASAKLYVESLQLGRAEGEKRDRYLRHAHDDLDRLQRMVESLLETARVSSAEPQLRLERLDLAAETRSILAEIAREPATTAQIALTAPKPVAVLADRGALRTIFGNLISNASKYAGPNPQVEIEIGAEGGRALMRVRDRGPGLDGLDPERVFEPFVRGSGDRVKTRPGVGLGLYMVAELARAHRGSVRAVPIDQGFAVEIVLPLAGAAQGSPA
jgi:signal transduction histidine kinase